MQAKKCVTKIKFIVRVKNSTSYLINSLSIGVYSIRNSDSDVSTYYAYSLNLLILISLTNEYFGKYM